MRFKDKIALVTGGASGVGKATCLAFAREGVDLAILDLFDPEEVVSEIKNLGRKAIAFKVDIANFRDVSTCIQKVYDDFKRIDFLINNAGVGDHGPFAEMSEERWDRSIAVNLKGVFNTTRAVINNMMAQKSGKIVNISSAAGIMGVPKNAHYSAAKAGVIGMSKALAKEAGPYNININVIAPGSIDTPFFHAAIKRTPDVFEKIIQNSALGRIGKPEEIASLVLYLCSEDAAYITGQVISPNGGQYI